ncbi:hypothetical protein TH5_03750, partial [Thalassospira xianhensis MCCC 1A02616]
MAANMTARDRNHTMVQNTWSDIAPIALEQRFMFDAAGAATGAEAAQDAAAEAEAENAHADSDGQSSNDAGDNADHVPAAVGGIANNDRKDVVIVDPAVQDYQTLIDGLGANVEVIILQQNATVSDIASVLDGMSGIDGLHILSHGGTGALNLGGGALTLDTLAANADALQLIGNALSETGDIVLYGCNIGADGSGQDFINQLSALTGADISASDDMTGADALGGDWDMEAASGDIETPVIFADTAMQSFADVLAATSDSFDAHGANISPGVTSFSLGDWTFGSSSAMGMANASAGEAAIHLNNDGGAGDRAVFMNYESTQGFTDFYFKSTDGTDFDLNSFDIGNNFSLAGTNVTIVGYKDGVEVAGTSELVNLTTSDSAGVITYSTTDTNSDDGYFGTLTFGSAYDAVDEVRFTFDANGSLAIDNLNVSPVVSNAAPDLGGTPADVTVTEDIATAIDLSAYNVSDGDGDTITLTLAVDRGTIAGAAGTGITINNSGSGAMTLQGSAANLNSYLNDTTKITYTPASNDTTAATLTVTPNDGTVNGTADTVTINITAENDAPTATNLTQTLPFTEDGGSVALGDIVVTDVDSGDTVTATLTVGNIAAGTLTTGTFGSATSTYNAGTGVWTVSGSVTDVNAALAAVAFTPAANWDQDVTITTRIRDAADTGPADGTITLDATAVNDAPVATTSGGSTSFTEGGGAVVIDSSFTLSDVDTTNMTGATIEITSGYETPWDQLDVQDAFAFQGAGVTYSYDSSTGIMTLAGTATAAQYQALIRQIVYFNNSQDPSTANRTISITVNDGTNNSDVATKTLLVTGVNDAPTLSATGGTPSFTENGSAVDLFSGVTIGTVEAGQTISGMTFTVTNAEASDRITFDGTAITLSDGVSGATTGGNSLTYNVSVAGGIATVTISGGSMTTASAQTVIDGMTYSSTSDNPGTSSRVVTLTGITDSGGTANGGVDSASVTIASTVTVNAVNDAPALANGGNSVNFSAGSGTEIVISNSLTVLDVDDTTLASATVSITNGFATGDTLSFTTDGAFGNITGTYDAGTGVLSLESEGGTATVAQWQAALRSVTFSNADASPATGTRTISFVVNDGDVESTAATSSVNIVFAPVIGNLNGDSVTYSEGGGAVAIDTGTAATVTDSDNTDFNGGNLTVSITAGSDAAQDILTLDTGGMITLEGNTAGSDVSVGGMVIGTLANNIAAGNDLVINFDENATPARVASLLAAIQYSNNSTDDPTAGARTVRVTLTDASGGFTSSPADVTVNVVGVNDAPAVSATGGTPTFTENGTAVDLFSGVTIGTGETGQTISGMTFTVTNAEASDRITFDGTAIILTDGTSGTTTDGNGLSYNVSVTGVVATITITGGTLTVAQAQAVVDGMTYSSTSDNPGASSRVVTLTGITDSGGTANGGADAASVSIAATVAVSAVNDAPVNTVPGSQSAVAGEAKAINGISVSDADSATVTTTVSVPNGAGTFSATGNATITGGGTNSIQISGSVADVNTTLANLRYTATTTGSQTITVLTSDGTDTGTDTVTVNVTARPAIGGLSGDSIAYTTGQTVKLDSGQNATVSDADFQTGAFSNGGNLTVSITGGGTASQDILKIDTAGTVTLDGTTAGSNVRVNGTIIGTLANGIAAGNALRINFNTSANLTNIQELVRAVAYENSSGTPTAGNRTISVTLSDIDGNSSTVSTVTVRVTAPVVTPPPPPPPAPPPAPVVTIPPILQTPGSGGDAGTPVSNALSAGSNGSGSGGQFISGGPIQTTVTGQLGNTSPIGNSGTPVSAGLSVNQAGSGLGVTTGLGGGGGAVLTSGGFGSLGGSGLGGGLGGGIGGIG